MKKDNTPQYICHPDVMLTIGYYDDLIDNKGLAEREARELTQTKFNVALYSFNIRTNRYQKAYNRPAVNDVAYKGYTLQTVWRPFHGNRMFDATSTTILNADGELAGVAFSKIDAAENITSVEKAKAKIDILTK